MATKVRPIRGEANVEKQADDTAQDGTGSETTDDAGELSSKVPARGGTAARGRAIASLASSTYTFFAVLLIAVIDPELREHWLRTFVETRDDELYAKQLLEDRAFLVNAFYTAVFWDCFFIFAAAFMQVTLPVALLYDVLRDAPVSAYFMSVTLPAASSVLLVKLAKGIVGTYVFYVVYESDFPGCMYLYILCMGCATERMYRHAAALATVFAVYFPVVLLVFWTSLILIVRSTTTTDVVLSGVGALFIFEFDNVLARKRKREAMVDSVAAALVDKWSGFGSRSLTVVHMALASLPSLTMAGVWVFFLYQVHASRQ